MNVYIDNTIVYGINTLTTEGMEKRSGRRCHAWTMIRRRRKRLEGGVGGWTLGIPFPRFSLSQLRL